MSVAGVAPRHSSRVLGRARRSADFIDGNEDLPIIAFDDPELDAVLEATPGSATQPVDSLQPSRTLG